MSSAEGASYCILPVGAPGRFALIMQSCYVVAGHPEHRPGAHVSRLPGRFGPHLLPGLCDPRGLGDCRRGRRRRRRGWLLNDSSPFPRLSGRFVSSSRRPAAPLGLGSSLLAGRLFGNCRLIFRDLFALFGIVSHLFYTKEKAFVVLLNSHRHTPVGKAGQEIVAPVSHLEV